MIVGNGNNKHFSQQEGSFLVRLFKFFAYRWLVYVLFLLPVVAYAQQVNINALKAVFLFNFANFVTWPDSSFGAPGETIRYCTMGNLRVHKNLVQVTSQEKVRGRGFHLLVINNTSELKQLRCHALFIANSALLGSDISLSELAQENVLTIGESPEFIGLGGMIYLKHQKKRIRIEIGMENVKNSQLEISSKLLRLAEIK